MGGGPVVTLTATIRADTETVDAELRIARETMREKIRRLYREATNDYAEGHRLHASGLAKAEQARKLQRQLIGYEAGRRTPNLGVEGRIEA